MADLSAVKFVSVPELAERFDTTPGRVRQLIEQKLIGAFRVDGVVRIPEAFLVGNEPLASLQGTLVVLEDAGFSNEEAMDWLFEEHEALGMTPIASLQAGHKSQVRRLAQSLAY